MQKVVKTVHQYWWLHVHLVSENTQLPRTVSVYTCHLSVDQKFSLCESFWLCASAEYTLCVLSFAWLWYMFCPMGQLISWGRHALSAWRPRGQAAITRPSTLRRFWSRGQGRLWPLKVSAMVRLCWGLCSVSRVLYFPVSNCASLWHAFCATGLCVWSLESKWMNQILDFEPQITSVWGFQWCQILPARGLDCHETPQLQVPMRIFASDWACYQASSFQLHVFTSTFLLQ